MATDPMIVLELGIIGAILGGMFTSLILITKALQDIAEQLRRELYT